MNGNSCARTRVRLLKRLRFSAALLTSTALLGCSLIDPYVRPDDSVAKKFSDSRSLADSIVYAEELRDAYKGAISDQAILNNGVGLALIPISALAAYYGITGGHTNTILGLGLGGAGAYIGANYLHSEPRQFVYAAGVTAVSCAISVIEPMRAAQIALADDGGSLTPRIADMEIAASDLEQLIQSSIDVVGSESSAITKAQAAVDEARAMATDGRAVEVALKSSGGTLFGAVQQIEATVSKAIIDTEPNLSALVSSLGSALPLRAGQIAPQPKPATTVPKTTPTNDLALKAQQESLEQQLNTRRETLERRTILVREIVDLVSDRTPAEELQNCGVDISKAGLTFKLTPDAPVSFVNAGSAETVTVSVRGGEPPYNATWIGVTPSDITVAVAPSANWDGSGVLTIKETTASAADGKYSLLVHDAGVGAAIIEVNAANAAAGGGGGRNAAGVTGSVAPIPDPQVAELQALLLRAGHDPGKIDGLFGEDTLAAVRSFTGDAGLTEDAARAAMPDLVTRLRAAPAAPVAPPVVGPATDIPSLSAEEELLVRDGYRLLAARACVDSAEVPPNATAALNGLSAGVAKLLAANPGLGQMGNEDAVARLRDDTGMALTCAGQ